MSSAAFIQNVHKAGYYLFPRTFPDEVSAVSLIAAWSQEQTSKKIVVILSKKVRMCAGSC